jgi:hypothetical protein
MRFHSHSQAAAQPYPGRGFLYDNSKGRERHR